MDPLVAPVVPLCGVCSSLKRELNLLKLVVGQYEDLLAWWRRVKRESLGCMPPVGWAVTVRCRGWAVRLVPGVCAGTDIVLFHFAMILVHLLTYLEVFWHPLDFNRLMPRLHGTHV